MSRTTMQDLRTDAPLASASQAELAAFTRDFMDSCSHDEYENMEWVYVENLPVAFAGTVEDWQPWWTAQVREAAKHGQAD